MAKRITRIDKIIGNNKPISIGKLKDNNFSIKAWICVYPEEEVTCSPLIKFIKPLQREVKSDRKFGVKTYECEITYRLKDELK